MNRLRLFGIIAFLSIFTSTRAQLAGTFSVPATYSTIGAALSALNSQGVSSTVTILVSAGHTETATAGGYSLTATGTSTSPIIIMKNGAGPNPVIYAPSGGAGTPNSTIQDGVLRLIGADYITIDGINITDNNTANPATMEFGIGLFRANALNGCQYNTIQNCVITLSRENNVFGSGPAWYGSRGIDVVDATTNAHTTYLTISGANGTNSYNKFYSNVIQNCNTGISMVGYFDSFPFTNSDKGNDIGGLSAVTGNTIVNFGGASGAVYEADAIYTYYQATVNIGYNLINNNNGAGVNHNTTLRGIYMSTSPSASVAASNNTITLHSGATSGALYPIYNIAGSTANNNTVTISNNVIKDCDHLTGTSTTFYGIYSGVNPSMLSISGNTFVNNSSNSLSGTWINIYQGSSPMVINLSNNLLNLGTYNATTTSIGVYGIYNVSGLSNGTLSVNSNTLQGLNHAGAHNSILYMIYNQSTIGQVNMQNNIYNNLVVNSISTIYMMFNYCYNGSITGNQIVGSLNKPTSGGTFYGYYSGSGSTGTVTIANNNWSNINFYQGCTYYGIYHISSTLQYLAINSNTINNVYNANFQQIYGMFLYYPREINNNVLTNFSGGNQIYGIYVVSATQSYTASGNTLAAMSTTGASNVYGFYNQTSVAGLFTKNKIYNLANNYLFGSGVVYGFYSTAGVSYTVSNNMIGDLRSPYAFNSVAIAGIYITGGSSYSLYYNTVHLNAVTNNPGNFFGSAAVYVSTGPTVEMRNNIFINNSTPSGGGQTVAYRRSSNNIATYVNTSNNNIFYAGTPGVNNLIYADGSNFHQTLAAYQAFVTPRDAASQTENTPFLSIAGTNSLFLHVNPAVTSLAESGAVNIAGR
jgi:hypothetical protein